MQYRVVLKDAPQGDRAARLRDFLARGLGLEDGGLQKRLQGSPPWLVDAGRRDLAQQIADGVGKQFGLRALVVPTITPADPAARTLLSELTPGAQLSDSRTPAPRPMSVTPQPMARRSAPVECGAAAPRRAAEEPGSSENVPPRMQPGPMDARPPTDLLGFDEPVAPQRDSTAGRDASASVPEAGADLELDWGRVRPRTPPRPQVPLGRAHEVQPASRAPALRRPSEPVITRRQGPTLNPRAWLYWSLALLVMAPIALRLVWNEPVKDTAWKLLILGFGLR
jgi:hypothetical protein